MKKDQTEAVASVDPESQRGHAPSLWGSCRLCLSLLLFLAVLHTFMLRFNLSMAVVCMKGEGDGGEVRLSRIYYTNFFSLRFREQRFILGNDEPAGAREIYLNKLPIFVLEKA